MPNIVPFGDRILVRRKKIGEKAGQIVLPQEVQERATDLAIVVHIPEATFADRQILENADSIVSALRSKAEQGHSDALIAMLRLTEFIKLRSIQVGDQVMISKYVGTEFHETGSNEDLTLVKLEDVIGLVVQK